MMGDDGEKFGAWPTTWEHCWGEGRWVERFFEALEANADWLTTVDPVAVARRRGADRPRLRPDRRRTPRWASGRSRPTRPSCSRSCCTTRSRRSGPEARWLRGGFWRNFQVKYREINDLHKQMLRTSRKVAAMAEGRSRTAALDHLYRGQSNDCYWHGLFGGIYITHMRLATYEHLIAAEDVADRALGTTRVAETRDLDMDGLPEVAPRGARPGRDRQAVRGRGHRRVGHPGGAARAGRGHAPPTRGLPRDPARPRGEGPAPTPRPVAEGGAPASIHDLVMVKEEGLSRRLFYDEHERRSGLVRFLAPDVAPEAVATAARGGAGRLPRRRLRASTTSRRARSRCRATARRSASRSW